MKRRAFFFVSVICFIVLLMTAAGIMVQSTTLYFDSSMPVVSYYEQIETAQIGMKIAENWLLDALLHNNMSSVSILSGTAEDRAAARLSNGSSVTWINQFDGVDLKLYVADTNYPSGLFASFGSVIPRMMPTVTSDDICRYYYLRSTATELGGGSPLICEELLAVSMDMSGGVIGVRRLFYRSK